MTRFGASVGLLVIDMNATCEEHSGNIRAASEELSNALF
jgi:hypothetical protein